jgi:hypothetical protein
MPRDNGGVYTDAQDQPLPYPEPFPVPPEEDDK